MASGVDKLAEQIERLPLDTALKAAVLEGVANTDEETAEREAASLRAVLDRIPARRRAIREALDRENHRQQFPRRLGISEKLVIGVAIVAIGAGLLISALNRE